MMRSISIAALFLCMTWTAAIAADCPNNAHVANGERCECNTGYAKTKAGLCVLKRANLDDEKAAAKAAKPKAEKAEKTQ